MVSEGVQFLNLSSGGEQKEHVFLKDILKFM